MASWQSIPDQGERAQVKRADASAMRIQRAAVPALAGGRIDPRGLTPQGILQLQRTAGNAAVNALLNGRPARGTAVQRAAVEDEAPVQAMGSAQYEAVQRHTHRIHEHPKGTNVWNTDDEND